MLALLDAGRADQHRLALLPRLVDQPRDRLVFLRRRAIDLVVLVLAGDRDVGRDLDHFQLVDLGELVGFRHRRAGHAGELRVEAEVVLEGDRGERLVLRLDGDVLLGLERLMQPVRVAPPLHHAAGELVDDDDLVVPDDVVDVAREQRVRAQRLLDVMHDRDVEDVVEVALLDDPGLPQHVLNPLGARLGQRDRADLLVLVIGLGVGDEHLHDDIHPPVKIRAVLGGAGDDERRPRLVDQDAVHLVHDAVGEIPLGHVLQPVLHVVAEIVEAELVVGAVGDVGGVGARRCSSSSPCTMTPGRQAEEAVDLAHPLGVAAGKVVVHRDDVDALAGERIEIDRQRRDQGLALAGLHLGDLAVVQDHAADELHVEMPLAKRALARLADHGEGLGQQFVERGAVREPLAELVRLGPQRLVGQACDRGFQRIDLRAPGADKP